MSLRAVVHRPGAVARPPRVLVPLIREELAAAERAGLEHYRRAGEMLREAKAQLDHGEWLPWLDEHFELSERSARRYMKLAELAEENGHTWPFSSLRAATQPAPERRSVRVRYVVEDTPPPPPEKPPQSVGVRVDVERLRQEEQARAAEARLQRDLARHLIDVGYEVLAAKLHPDKNGGGSDETMARLNSVRGQLRELVERVQPGRARVLLADPGAQGAR